MLLSEAFRTSHTSPAMKAAVRGVDASGMAKLALGGVDTTGMAKLALGGVDTSGLAKLALGGVDTSPVLPQALRALSASPAMRATLGGMDTSGLAKLAFAWAKSAVQLVDLASTSAWAESATYLIAALEDSAGVESFADSAGIEIEPMLTRASPNDIASDSLARKRRRAVLLTAAVYLAAALTLHLSNYISTPDPVFDPHQFITDEFIAMGLALAFYCAFWAV
jgi:hypothetical protein